MPLVQTRGAASAQGFGEFAQAAAVNYIEDVFSTYLYTGNGSTQTITNGINLSTKGGLVWTKKRAAPTSGYVENHNLIDTARGVQKGLASNNADAQDTNDYVTAFSTTGYTVGNTGQTNQNGDTYASWTFRKQPKFFDVVTYTGDGNNNRLISHSLGSTPACVIIKCTSDADAWAVWHRSLTSTQYSMFLNTTAAQGNAQTNQSFSFDGSVSMSSTQFVVSQESGNANSSGKTYVAYLFAHNAGGFGLTGTDNVISCGSYTTDGSGNATVNLGYEPQWLLWKRSDSTSNWSIYDTTRGWSLTGDELLSANLTNAALAVSVTNRSPTATGFQFQPTGQSNASATFIYIAIRRGPMKVPTDATSVFAPVAYTGNSSTQTITTNFPVDLMLSQNRVGGDSTFVDRLRGFGTATNATKYLFGDLTDAEGGASNGVLGMTNTGLNLGSWAQTNFSSQGYASWNMRRAPSFFDEVCYSGNSSTQNITHNLGVAPEFVIIKSRTSANAWRTFNSFLSATFTRGELNVADALVANQSYAGGDGFNSKPTSTTLPLDYSPSNYTGQNYVAYLFATCAGVSKVGSYTGNGTTQTINCGLTAGARFVLIKRTDASGDWYVYDTARGMTTLTDPYLRLNTTDAESATLGSVTTVATGFALNSAILAAINVSAGTYIFLAIA